MQTKAGKDVDTRMRVGSGEKRNPSAMHRVDDYKLFLHERFSRSEIVSIEIVFNLLSKPLPRHIFPVCRDILGASVMSKVSLIDQIAAALPHQRWTLPRVILRQQSEQGLCPLRIVGR